MNVLDIQVAFILTGFVFTFFLKKTKLKKITFYSRRLTDLDDLKYEMDCGFHKKISVCDDYISFLSNSFVYRYIYVFFALHKW